jgi:hypothetical protein
MPSSGYFYHLYDGVLYLYETTIAIYCMEDLLYEDKSYILPPCTGIGIPKLLVTMANFNRRRPSQLLTSTTIIPFSTF